FPRAQLLQPLHVIASGVSSKKAVVMTSESGNFKTLRELTECMRASMLLLGITGPMTHMAPALWCEPSTRWFSADFLEIQPSGSPLGLLSSPCTTGCLVTPPNVKERLVDSQLYEQIPFQTALDDGCTHVLVLRSRPDGG
ncbi:unnamed protein product, partial [Scytosiphon promiscuus]